MSFEQIFMDHGPIILHVLISYVLLSFLVFWYLLIVQLEYYVHLFCYCNRGIDLYVGVATLYQTKRKCIQ